MRKSSLFLIALLFFYCHDVQAQTASQGISTSWGNYVKTGLPGYGPTLLEVRIDGQNRIWNGIFSINGINSYTPSLHWNNVRLLSYSTYNTGKDDVKVFIMSNNSTTTFGTTEIILKSETNLTGTANLQVTVLGGQDPAALSLVDNSTTAPYTYTMASSAGTLNMWTVNNNVGIGTTDPRTQLDLGNLRLGSTDQFPAEGSIQEGDWANFIIGNTNWQRLRMGLANDGYTRSEIDLHNSNRADGTIAFKTTNTSGGAATRMFIHGSGNIGIGTGTTELSDYKLAVNGTVGAKKVKVTQTGWPDYVFSNEYRLRPLPELETFLKANKHLPEIPSADEIEKNGLDLGDNQAALLKKIEELTLYVIEQDKKIRSQENEIKQLQSKNAKVEELRAEWEEVKKKLPAK